MIDHRGIHREAVELQPASACALAQHQMSADDQFCGAHWRRTPPACFRDRARRNADASSKARSTTRSTPPVRQKTLAERTYLAALRAAEEMP